MGLIILAPLSAALLILLFRRFEIMLVLPGIGISLVASILLLAESYAGVNYRILLTGLPDMPFILIASPLTSLLSTMVSIISSLVLVFAVGYMKKDREKPRFFAIMLLFITAMQTLVLAGDWVLLLSAWEMIGLSSYLLIGFWFSKPGVKQAATRAFLVTRSADLALYLAIFMLIANTGSSDIQMTLSSGSDAVMVAGIFLLIGAMGKSAQTPMHSWLQAAMAGPTPVSALLHSATLVAAGAILLIRSAPMLSDDTLLIIGLVGGVTTVVTGLIALAEDDLKRLLAASTSSQYGLMLIAVGAGVPMAALFHLLAHAAIKSSLFVGAGIFQHSRGSTLFERLAGIGRERPRIFIGFSLAALALAGIPPLSGFFSKDAIIAASLSSNNMSILLPLALAGTLLTGAYMAKTLSILWRRKEQPSVKTRPLSGLVWMGTGLTGLVVLAVVLGVFFPGIELLLGFQQQENSFNQTVAMILGLVAALTGLWLGWRVPAERLLGPVSAWAKQGFIVAGGFDKWLVAPAFIIASRCQKLEALLYQRVLAVGRTSYKLSGIIRRNDEKNIDGLINLMVRTTIEFGQRARNLQSGLIHKELAISILVGSMIFTLMLIFLWLY